MQPSEAVAAIKARYPVETWGIFSPKSFSGKTGRKKRGERVATYHGKPCELGHTERYESNGKCVACYREYKRNWYTENMK